MLLPTRNEGCSESPDCLPDAPRWSTSNHGAGEWGLEWAELMSGDWQLQFLECLHQQNAIRECWLLGVGLLHQGIVIRAMYMSWTQVRAGGKLGASLYELLLATGGSTAGASLYELENCGSSTSGTCSRKSLRAVATRTFHAIRINKGLITK